MSLPVTANAQPQSATGQCLDTSGGWREIVVTGKGLPGRGLMSTST